MLAFINFARDAHQILFQLLFPIYCLNADSFKAYSFKEPREKNENKRKANEKKKQRKKVKSQ